MELEKIFKLNEDKEAYINFIEALKTDATKRLYHLNLLDIKAATLGINTKDKSWPKSASHLSHKLKELVTTFREIGINITWSTNSRSKHQDYKDQEDVVSATVPAGKTGSSTKFWAWRRYQ